MLLVDFGAVVPVPGCSNNPSRLEKLTGDARPNASLTFQMSLPQGAGVTPLLFFSTAPAVEEGALACGLNTSFGELLIGLGGGQLIGRLRGATSTGSTTPFLVKIPNDPNLVDQKLWMQGAFWDAANVAPGPVFSLTNGMYLEIGAP